MLFVNPYNTAQITRGWGLGPNGLGHAAIAYNLDGVTRVMNIVGSGQPAMVNFLTLPDYLFGTHNFDNGCEQGGVYNRNIQMVALWNVPEERVRAMDGYYQQAKQQSEGADATAQFAIALAPSLNRLDRFFKRPKTYGNCAIYTSRGLREAGVLKHACMWPKELFVRVMQEGRKNPDDMRIISFPRIEHAKMTLGAGAGRAGFLGTSRNPVKWAYTNWKYWRLGDYADAEVVVPLDSTRAQTRLLQPYSK